LILIVPSSSGELLNLETKSTYIIVIYHSYYIYLVVKNIDR